jgi:hypothetical protein
MGEIKYDPTNQRITKTIFLKQVYPYSEYSVMTVASMVEVIIVSNLMTNAPQGLFIPLRVMGELRTLYSLAANRVRSYFDDLLSR